MAKKVSAQHTSLTYGNFPPPRVNPIFHSITPDMWVKKPQWVGVVSSNVAAIQFEPELDALEIQFTSGRIYAYESVGKYFAIDMYTCNSMGTFVWERIRRAKIFGLLIAVRRRSIFHIALAPDLE